jgi:hypothetical protein
VQNTNRADLIRSTTTLLAGIVVLVGNTKEGEADGIAASIASCTIALGALLGYYEWVVNLRDHLAAEKARKERGLDEEEGDEGADDNDEAAADDKEKVAVAVDRKSTALSLESSE